MGKECFSHVEFKVSTISCKHNYSQVSNSKFQAQDVALSSKVLANASCGNTSFETTARRARKFFSQVKMGWVEFFKRFTQKL
jgi:hypothetical protein